MPRGSGPSLMNSWMLYNLRDTKRDLHGKSPISKLHTLIRVAYILKPPIAGVLPSSITAIVSHFRRRLSLVATASGHHRGSRYDSDSTEISLQ